MVRPANISFNRKASVQWMDDGRLSFVSPGLDNSILRWINNWTTGLESLSYNVEVDKPTDATDDDVSCMLPEL
jgi:hypothetical protein